MSITVFVICLLLLRVYSLIIFIYFLTIISLISCYLFLSLRFYSLLYLTD